MTTEMNLLNARIQELERENATLKQQHIEVIEAKELYLKIFEEFPALIWRSRLDKLCDYFNKTWLDFTGRTMEQEFGNGWTEGVHPDDFDFCVQTYVTAFDKREAFLMDYRMKNSLGEYRWIRDFGRPFYDLDNTFLGYIGSCYDITENKNNELKLIELNATKDKFFSIIAHDLKTPFNSIVGYSELLCENIRQMEYETAGAVADIILKSSNRAMDLLNNIMTWARSQSGTIDFSPQKFDINALINEVAVLSDDIARQKNIQITKTLSAPSLVIADYEMINTVMRNLISNAIKFTQPGGKITISAEEKQNQLIVSVSDTGVGISQERIDNLFTIGGGDSTSGTQNEKGTGLGLILCKEFVNKNNGEIWIESNAGTGTTLYFSLPISTKNALPQVG